MQNMCHSDFFPPINLQITGKVLKIFSLLKNLPAIGISQVWFNY